MTDAETPCFAAPAGALAKEKALRGPQPAAGSSQTRAASSYFARGGGIFDDDDAALRESITSAEREKIWATDDRAKGFAGGCRGLVIIQGYAREHALLDIVRERLEREGLKRECLQGGAKCRRHR